MSISRGLMLIFLAMIIVGAVLSFTGALVDSDDEGDLLSGNPGFGNELSFLLVLVGGIGLVGTFTLRGLPTPWDKH